MMRELQQKLKAPKGQRNTFADYNYRSCEDIVEAVKPLLHEKDLHLILTDELVNAGDRFYVKATASVMNGEKVVSSACGYAREALSKKGFDESQITGAASSYARKYALNGLFAIDDAKDADSDEHAKQQQRPDNNQQQSASDDKPWYNDFDQHKDMMADKIGDGQSTADEIITNLRKSFKVSKKTAEQIKALETA